MDVGQIVTLVAGATGALMGIASFVTGMVKRLETRETLTPTPVVQHPTVEVDALRREVEALSQRVSMSDARSTDHREEVIASLARIGERLKIRQEEKGHGRASD